MRPASSGSPKSRRRGRTLIRRLVYVAFFLEVGLLLLVLPWSAFWENNYFAEAWPLIRPFLTNNFVRGGVTGLGVVNLVIAGVLYGFARWVEPHLPSWLTALFFGSTKTPVYTHQVSP